MESNRKVGKFYSGTSDKGPSEIGKTSLQMTFLRHHANTLVYYFTSEIGATSLQWTKLLSPKVSLVRRFHSILYLL